MDKRLNSSNEGIIHYDFLKTAQEKKDIKANTFQSFCYYL